MNPLGYREEELVGNRAALLLWGGTDADRQAWAAEAASNFPEEGGLVEVRSPAQLLPALERTRGVVFVPDVLALGLEAQMQLVRCLRLQEERPKLVLGLPVSAAVAEREGRLRDDLSYLLQRARVDLSDSGLKEAIRARRLSRQAQARPGRGASKATKRPAARRPAQKPARARLPKKKTRSHRA